MPTNANTFNSRVTSEALESKFRQVFPSQGGAELVQDLYASGVIMPVIDFSSVAEGSNLAQSLQTAWDFSTGWLNIQNAVGSTIISNTGFWKVDLNCTAAANAADQGASLFIDDGVSVKVIWRFDQVGTGALLGNSTGSNEFVVFLRAGDTLKGTSTAATCSLDVNYRQIADVYGNLVNPLGYSPQ